MIYERTALVMASRAGGLCGRCESDCVWRERQPCMQLHRTGVCVCVCVWGDRGTKDWQTQRNTRHKTRKRGAGGNVLEHNVTREEFHHDGVGTNGGRDTLEVPAPTKLTPRLVVLGSCPLCRNLPMASP